MDSHWKVAGADFEACNCEAAWSNTSRTAATQPPYLPGRCGKIEKRTVQRPRIDAGSVGEKWVCSPFSYQAD
jgi:hypothetical protein